MSARDKGNMSLLLCAVTADYGSQTITATGDTLKAEILTSDWQASMDS